MGKAASSSSLLSRRAGGSLLLWFVAGALGLAGLAALERFWWAKTAVEGKPIEAWLQQAASADFTERLAAERVLESLGARILPAARRALAARDDGWLARTRRRLAAWFPKWFRPPTTVVPLQIATLNQLQQLGLEAAPTAPEVIALLETRHPPLRVAAEACLRAMGEAALPAMQELLPSASPKARGILLAILATLPIRLDPAELRPITIPLLADPVTEANAASLLLRLAVVERDSASLHAVEAILHQDRPTAAEGALEEAQRLAAAIAHPTPPDRWQPKKAALSHPAVPAPPPAAEILGRLLDMALRHPDYLVQLEAAEADWLLRRAPDRVLPVLREVMENPLHIWRAALLARRMGPAARPLLPDLLAAVPREPVHRPDRTPAVSAMAAAAIGPEAVPGLSRLLDHPAWETRVSAARALEQFGAAAAPAVPGLIRLLEEPRAESQVVAAQTLGAIGAAAAPALPRLEQLEQTASGYPQDAAARAIQRIYHARRTAAADATRPLLNTLLRFSNLVP